MFEVKDFTKNIIITSLFSIRVTRSGCDSTGTDPDLPLSHRLALVGSASPQPPKSQKQNPFCK